MLRLSAFSSACLVLLVLACHASATELSRVRWQLDYMQAQSARVQRKQPMVVFLTMDGCRHCHRMMRTTYKDDRVAQTIATQYVATLINATHQQRLAHQFGARLYPTTVLVGPDNRIVDRIEGYVPPGELARRLSLVTARYSHLAQSGVHSGTDHATR